MSLIAGCFSAKIRIDAEGIFEKLKSFHILPGDSAQDYRYLRYDGSSGAIYAKYKQTRPEQVYSFSGRNFSVITLGFHDLDYPTDFAGMERTGEVIEKIQSSEGEFVSAVMDRLSGEIFIINNRFGTRPLYYMETAERVWFSSNAAFLVCAAGQRIEPDYVGLLQVINYGHTLTPRTHTKGMSRLFPGTRLHISGEGIKERRYWKLAHREDKGLEPKAYAGQTIEAFREGLLKKIRRTDTGFMSLSGGLDSRFVVGLAHKECGYFAFTFSNNAETLETPDVKVARQICQRLGIEHRVVQMTGADVSQVADELINLTGGMVPIHHPLKAWQSVKMMTETTGFKIGGGAGDPIAGDYINSIYHIEPDWNNTLIRLFCLRRKWFSRNLLAGILNRDIVEEYFGKMEDSMVESFSQLEGPTPAHKITAWAEVYFNSGFTFCGPIHNHPDVSEASPHLGYSYIDQMLRLPADWLYRKNFYRYMIYHAFPELQDIIYANTGQKLSGEMMNYRLSGRKRFCRSILQSLPFPIVSRIWAGPIMSRPSAVGIFASDRKLFERMNEILYSVDTVRTVFGTEGCTRFLSNYAQGRQTFGNTVLEDEMLAAMVSLFFWFRNVTL